MCCFLVSSSRKYYTGACLDPWRWLLSPQAPLHQGALCRSKERCSSMDRFANLSDEGMIQWCPCCVSFAHGKPLHSRDGDSKSFQLQWTFSWPFRMAKPHVEELWMFVFGLGESPAEVGNGMPEHKHKAIPEATNAINQFWWWGVVKCYGPLKQTKGALNALQFDQKAKFQFPRPMPDPCKN